MSTLGLTETRAREYGATATPSRQYGVSITIAEKGATITQARQYDVTPTQSRNYGTLITVDDVFVEVALTNWILGNGVWNDAGERDDGELREDS